jgi:alpha-aminoadipic semialdehyde synthase
MKFSWSPKGLLSAALNSARFKLDGELVQVPGEDLLRSYFPDVPLSKGFALEGLANRDSLGYADTYGLGSVDGMKSLFRGTLRYVSYKVGCMRI